jgi:hypothetical protein
MNTADQPGWFQCRRSKRCRAHLPAHELQRNPQSGAFECLPGKCPNDMGPGGQELVQKDIEIRQLRDKTRILERDRNRLIGMIDAEQERLKVALQIQTDKLQIPTIDRSPSKDGKNQSVPVMLCSDWHCGGVVRPSSVNNLNEYDVGIFHDRAQALFRNTLKVVNMVRSSSTVNEIVVWLGGDLIDNWLHPEQIQEQELSPTQQIIECERAIVAALNYLLEHGDFERIIVPCSHGNHGRTTQKMQAGNSHATSYEWLMYQSLQRHFRNEPRITWHIAEGNALYLEVLGKMLRFHHGDACKYQGGIGGLTIPLTKWIHRADQAIRADHTFQGHFHSAHCNPTLTVNGSLIGPTPYGMKLGFPPEPPQQVMRFIDSARGFTIAAPIFVD